MESDALQTPVTQASDNDRIFALIAKHRADIDGIIRLPPDALRTKLQELGLSPETLASHYEDLQARETDLMRRNAEVEKKAGNIGLVSGALMGIALSALAWKKNLSENRLINGFIIALTTFAAYIMGNGWSYRAMSRGLREEAKYNTMAGRAALEREVAIALENRQSGPAGPPVAGPLGTDGVQRPPVVPRESFTAEAMKDKTQSMENAATR